MTRGTTHHDHELQAPSAHPHGDSRGDAPLRRDGGEKARLRRRGGGHHPRRVPAPPACDWPLLGRPRGLGPRLRDAPCQACRRGEGQASRGAARLHQQAAHARHRLQGPSPQPRPRGAGRPPRGREGHPPHALARCGGDRHVHGGRDALPRQLPVPHRPSRLCGRGRALGGEPGAPPGGERRPHARGHEEPHGRVHCRASQLHLRCAGAADLHLPQLGGRDHRKPASARRASRLCGAGRCDVS